MKTTATMRRVQEKDSIIFILGKGKKKKHSTFVGKSLNMHA